MVGGVWRLMRPYAFLSLPLNLKPVAAAGKETRLQCSCQDSHFINRKGPSPSAQQGWV